MPLIYVQRYSLGIITGVGTQYIESGGAFVLNGYGAFEPDPTVYTAKGTYVLVDYSLGSFTYDTITYPSGQAALDALVTVDMSLMPTGWTALLTDDSVNKLIKLTLA